MTNASDALKDFEKSGTTEKVDISSKNFGPSVRLFNDEGKIGMFLTGKVLGRREVTPKDGDGKRVFYSIRAEKTDGDVTIRNPKTKQYDAHTLVPGEVVSLMASSRLDRGLKDLAPGTRVFIRYDGMKKIETPKGKVSAHIYEIRVDKNVVLTDEDKAYIAANRPKVTNQEAAEKASQDVTEADMALDNID